MKDKKSLPRKLTIEIYYDAMNPEDHDNSQDLLATYLEKWNHGQNKFISEPIGEVSEFAKKYF